MSSEPILVDDDKTPENEPKKSFKKKVEFVPPAYETKNSILGRFKNQIIDKDFKKFEKLLRTTYVNIPFLNLILDCLVYNNLFKDVIIKMRYLQEAMVIVIMSVVLLFKKHCQRSVKIQIVLLFLVLLVHCS